MKLFYFLVFAIALSVAEEAGTKYTLQVGCNPAKEQVVITGNRFKQALDQLQAWQPVLLGDPDFGLVQQYVDQVRMAVKEAGMNVRTQVALFNFFRERGRLQTLTTEILNKIPNVRDQKLADAFKAYHNAGKAMLIECEVLKEPPVL